MTENQLKKMICDMFLDGESDFPLDADTKLLEEGICDSLGLIQLVGEIEKIHPGIKIQDQEISRDNFGTMAQILEFVANKAGVS